MITPRIGQSKGKTMIFTLNSHKKYKKKAVKVTVKQKEYTIYISNLLSLN